MWIPLQCQRKDRRRLNHAAGPLIGDERYLASQNGASPQYAVRRSASAAPKMAAYLKCVRLNAHDWQRINQSAQGNRANRLCCNAAGEVVVVPCGDLSPEAEGVLAGGCARQVQRHVVDGGEVGWGVVGSDAASVITEDHVHDPMQAVASRPEEFHLRPLTERGGSLSAHTAPTKQPTASLPPRSPPVASWTLKTTAWPNPFAPAA